MEMIEVDEGFASPTNAPALGRRSSSSTAMWGTARRRGGGSSTGSPTTSRSSPGTHQGPVAHPIRRNRFGMAGYADCLAGFVERLGLERPHVAGLSFGGALALEFYRRHPASAGDADPGVGLRRVGRLVACRCRRAAPSTGARAGRSARPRSSWSAAADDVLRRRRRAESVDAFGASMLAFHPAGFRAMARASAEDLRDVLPHIKVPTLLVYGDTDVRAPLTVAEDLHAAISGSTLVVLPDAGHVCNIEAPEAFNSAVRSFLRDRRS